MLVMLIVMSFNFVTEQFLLHKETNIYMNLLILEMKYVGTVCSVNYGTFYHKLYCIVGYC